MGSTDTPLMKLFISTALLLVALGAFVFQQTNFSETRNRLEFGDSKAIVFPGDEITSRIVELENRWAQLATNNISSTGDVAYGRFRLKTQAIDQLFTNLISRFSIDELENAQKKALLINVYNILTIRGILEFYPINSVMDRVDHTRLGFHFWKDTRVWIGRKSLSLDDIEHEILRKLGDPRIHFAIVCGAKSCPRILNSSYRLATIEAQLQAQAEEFFSAEVNFKLNRTENTVLVSSLIKWFGVDFGKNEQEILTRLEEFLPASMRDDLQRPLGEHRIVDYLPYNWALNDWQ